MSANGASDFAPWQLPTAKRRFRRWSVDVPAYVDVGSASHYCTVTDISPGGARARLLDAEPLVLGTEVCLDLDGYGSVPAEVRHSASGVLGLRFRLDEAEQLVLAQWLASANIERRQRRYTCHIEGLIRTAGAETPCLVTDISRTGAGIRVEEAGNLVLSDEIVLTLPGRAPMAAIVRHIAGEKVGLILVDGYEGELPPTAAEAASRVN